TCVHPRYRRGERLRMQDVRVLRESREVRDRRQRMRRPARRRASLRKPFPDDLDAIHVLPAAQSRLRLRRHHCYVMPHAHQLAAQVERVALQTSHLRRKVDALLEDPHGCQSPIVRALPVSRCMTMSAMRSPALPSPYGFDTGAARASRSSIAVAPATIRARSVPTSRAMPASTPSGRSVTSRITSTGVPKLGASSWMPPESVITSAA